MVVAGPMSRHAEDLAVVLAILVSGSNKPSLNLSTKVRKKNDVMVSDDFQVFKILMQYFSKSCTDLVEQL